MMDKLLLKIEKLKKSKVKKLVDKRIKDFRKIGKNNNEKVFSELCFCVLTANFNAERAIEIQKKMGNKFCTLNEKQLAEKLREYGHRFPNTRAKHIIKSRKYKNNLKKIMKSFDNEKEARGWLVKNVAGLGYKESSHFLRNIGYSNVAIIDFHIVDLLEKHGLIERPKTLTRKRYLEIEDRLQEIAHKSKLTLAELDLYLWYIETGKVLK